MSINKVMLAGNLTRDPELKALPNGTSVLTFGLAVNERRKNAQTGQWEDRPNYFDCNVFGTRAQGLAGRIRKGSKVALEGKLRWNQWQDANTGQNRSRVDVTVEELEFMEPRGAQPVQAAPVPAQPAPVQVAGQPLQMQPVPAQPVQAAPVQDMLANEDIPF